MKREMMGKSLGARVASGQWRKQGGTTQYSLSGIRTLIGNCMGKEEVEGRVRAKGIGRNERCDLSFHQRFKETKQDVQMENILLLFLYFNLVSISPSHANICQSHLQ